LPVKLYVRFFNVFLRFFQNPKKHDFLRFFELLHTFSRTVATGLCFLHCVVAVDYVYDNSSVAIVTTACAVTIA